MNKMTILSASKFLSVELTKSREEIKIEKDTRNKYRADFKNKVGHEEYSSMLSAYNSIIQKKKHTHKELSALLHAVEMKIICLEVDTLSMSNPKDTERFFSISKYLNKKRFGHKNILPVFLPTQDGLSLSFQRVPSRLFDVVHVLDNSPHIEDVKFLSLSQYIKDGIVPKHLMNKGRNYSPCAMSFARFQKNNYEVINSNSSIAFDISDGVLVIV